MLYLVRHADAGDKRTWTAPDDQRPLTDVGRRQADGLVKQLDGQPVDAILSSPARRCLQTVEPLARARGLAVRINLDLAVDGDPDRALAMLLAQTSDRHTVWCSHGELIGALLTRLADRGVALGAAPAWPKGSTWLLGVSGGRVTHVRYRPPPEA